MSKTELTPWFDAVSQSPYREGWYDVKLFGVDEIMRLWWASHGYWYAEPTDYWDIPWEAMHGAKWRGLLTSNKHHDY